MWIKENRPTASHEKVEPIHRTRADATYPKGIHDQALTGEVLFALDEALRAQGTNLIVFAC